MNKTRIEYLQLLREEIEKQENDNIKKGLIDFYNNIVDYEKSIERITKATKYYKKQYKSFINAFEKLR